MIFESKNVLFYILFELFFMNETISFFILISSSTKKDEWDGLVLDHSIRLL